MKDPKTIAQEFFAAYDAHDVEGMVACCADDAKAWYAPYGRGAFLVLLLHPAQCSHQAGARGTL